MGETLPTPANNNEAPPKAERTAAGADKAKELLQEAQLVEDLERATLKEVVVLLEKLPEIKRSLTEDGSEYGIIKPGFEYAYRDLANREVVAKCKYAYLQSLELVAA